MRTPAERSPYSLFQEEIRDERPPDWPWRILVMCKLVNLATAAKAREVARPLFTDFPRAADMSVADEKVLARLLRPLGLQSRRAHALVRMSSDYVSGADGKRCFGVGKYASDSWKMFVEGELVDGVSDGKLRLYLDWAVGRGPDDAGSGASGAADAP